MRLTRRALTRPLVLAVADSLTAGCTTDLDRTDLDRNDLEGGTAEDSGDCAETEGPAAATTESGG